MMKLRELMALNLIDENEKVVLVGDYAYDRGIGRCYFHGYAHRIPEEFYTYYVDSIGGLDEARRNKWFLNRRDGWLMIWVE